MTILWKSWIYVPGQSSYSMLLLSSAVFFSYPNPFRESCDLTSYTRWNKCYPFWRCFAKSTMFLLHKSFAPEKCRFLCNRLEVICRLSASSKTLSNFVNCFPPTECSQNKTTEGFSIVFWSILLCRADESLSQSVPFIGAWALSQTRPLS